MNKHEESASTRAMRLLALVRERTEHSHEPVFVAELAPACQMSPEESEAAWRYLRDLRLIDTFSIPYTARINAQGIDALDSAPKSHSGDGALRTQPATARGYGRVDPQEGLDRAREVSKELDRLHAFLPTLPDSEISAYSTKSLPIGTFLQSKGQTFSVLTEEMLANAFKEEADRRRNETDRSTKDIGSHETETRERKIRNVSGRKRSRLEIASWIGGIAAAFIAFAALIVDIRSKSGEPHAPAEPAQKVGQQQVSGTQIGQVTGPVTIYNTPTADPASVEGHAPAASNPKTCSGDKTLTFSPSDPGVMQTGPDGRRIDLGDGGGGTRLEKWKIHWTAPAKVTAVECSGQRNEHVLAQNRDGSNAECIGSINGGNDALSMHVTWNGPCDQQ